MSLPLANLTLTNSFNDIRVRINQIIRDAASEAAADFSSNIVFAGANVNFTGANVTFNSTYVNFTSVVGFELPTGNTGQRQTITGIFRFNTDNNSPEWYNGSTWKTVAANNDVVSTTTFNAALANTNAWISTKANTTALTANVATLNTAISKRYEKANVESRFVQNTVFQTFRSNTNISLSKRYEVANVEAKLAVIDRKLRLLTYFAITA